MSRWTLAVVSAVVVGGGAVAGWRVDQLDDRLTSARAGVQARRETIEDVTARLEKTGNRLTAAQEELRTTRNRLRDESRELKRSQPCDGRFFAHVWLFPASGPVGTRVRFVGDCLVDRFNDTEKEIRAGSGIFLIRQLAETPGYEECEQIVDVSPFDIKIRNGRAEGHFTVGSEGSCFQQAERRLSVVPGVYELGIACRACLTSARFRVTP